jgi:hypothetical protein
VSSDQSLTFDRSGLAYAGFEGFMSFRKLLEIWIGIVPKTAGAYVVLRDLNYPPAFRDTNPGGHFKGQDPTVSVDVLSSNWIDGCHVIYIGKGDNLGRRLDQYARFGRGDPVGHWGGRYVWQLADSDDLIVAWRRCDAEQTAHQLETELLMAFRQRYGRLPFANLNSWFGNRVSVSGRRRLPFANLISWVGNPASVSGRSRSHFR